MRFFLVVFYIESMSGPPQPRDISVFYGNTVLASQRVVTPLIEGPGGGTFPVTVGTTNFGGTSSIIGTVDLPSSLCVGQGGKYTDGMIVQSNSNGTSGVWVNLTSQALVPQPPLVPQQFALLQGNTANNAVYFGGDVVFYGICYIPNLATPDLADNSLWQYWNGAAWIDFNVMASESVQPLNQFANTPFERSSGFQENLRFDKDIVSSWQLLMLNGFNKFWVRMILTGLINPIPEVTTVKLIPSYKLIDVDGHQEYFGCAKKCAEVVFHRKLLESVNGALPANEDINFTGTIVLNAQSNEFQDAVLNEIGGVISIPCNTCTAAPLKLVILWFPLTNNTGNVEWEVEVAQARAGDNINNNGLFSTILSQVVIVPANNSGVMFRTIFNLPIFTLVPNDILVIRIFRDATGGNPDDTLVGSVVLTEVNGEVVTWK